MTPRKNVFCLFALIAFLAGLASAQAANFYWQGDVAENPSDWMEPGNWDLGRVPGPEDHVVLHDFGASQLAHPVIDESIPATQYITPAWHAVDSTLTVNEGAQVETYNLILGQGAGATSDGKLIQNGGRIYARVLRVGYAGKGTVTLNGGELEAFQFSIGQEVGGGTGTIDLRGGLLILGNDMESKVQEWVSQGWLKAYAGSGRVVCSYGRPYGGRTAIWGVPDVAQNYGPQPASGALWPVENLTSLSLNFQPGNGASYHDVYFGTDFFEVESATPGSPRFLGRQGGNAVTPPSLSPGQTYYWRADCIAGGQIHKGPVWSFSITAEERPDLYHTTWVATDDLGRTLPDRAECGPLRDDREMAIYYVLWLGYHGVPGPFNVTEIIEANPSNPALMANAAHFWDEPEAGYYLADDPWVARRNIVMLTEAGMDILVLEATNGYAYTEAVGVLLDQVLALQAEGYDTDMKFVFWTHAGAPPVITHYYERFYEPELYQNLWYYRDGKPLFLGYPDGLATDDPRTSVTQEIKDFFSWRECWAWEAGQDKWQFVDDSPQDYSWHVSQDRPEQTVVTPASHATNNIGKSHSNGVQPPLNEYDLTGDEDKGIYFDEQWEHARLLDPEVIFLSEWNEWIAGAFVRNPGDPQYYFLGEPVQEGEIYFVDQYNAEYNRDIAPVKGSYTDNYYYQMISQIRRFKGVEKMPAAGGAASIAIDGDFADWKFVTPDFRDAPAETWERRHLGWGTVGTNTNQTGRNDFVACRVARDETHLAFYAETHEAVTSYSGGEDWMILLVDADQDAGTGWLGYDYRLNKIPAGNGKTSLEQNTAGTSTGWTLVSANGVDLAVSGKALELRLPRGAMNMGSGADPVAFDFHWVDNPDNVDDINSWFISGDTAPNRRFNYRYSTSKTMETVVLEDSFENGPGPGWGDWDITENDAYTGTHALECSMDDDAGISRYWDFSNYDSFRISFRYKMEFVNDSDDIHMWYHDGDTWNLIADLNQGKENNVWMRHTDVRYNRGGDTNFFQGPLHFHIQGMDLDAAWEYVFIDDIIVTAYGPESRAHSPFPADGATGVPADIQLGWTAAPGAGNQTVYLGTTAPGSEIGSVSGKERLQPEPLRLQTTYYWRVDTKVGENTVTGPVWTFTTADLPPAQVESPWRDF